jgi:phage shock protein C
MTASTDIKDVPLPLRNDTILGVCEAVGEDFGFNANWLRLAFAAGFYFSPVLVVASYAGLGLLVAATRYFAPKQVSGPQVADSADNSDQERLPLAA